MRRITLKIESFLKSHSLVILCLATLYYITTAYFLILNYPAIWPDEALFADTALAIANHGQNSLPLWKGFFSQIEFKQFIMPPGYFYFMAGVFKLFSFDILVMRLTSIIFFIGALLAIKNILSALRFDSWVIHLVLALALVDPMLIRGSYIGRMDMMAICLSLWALYFSLKSEIRKSDTLFSSIFSSFAVLTHPFAIITPISICLFKLIKKDYKSLLLICLSGSLISLVWLIPVLQNVDLFKEHFGAQLVRKAVSLKGVSYASIFKTYLNEYLHIGAGSILKFTIPTLATLASVAIISTCKKNILITIFHLLVGIMLFKNLEMWYVIWALPTILIGLAIAISDQTPGLIKRYSTLLLFLLIPIQAIGSIASIKGPLNGTLDSRTTKGDYVKWASDIAAKIPNGSKVFISSLPDPYFELKKNSSLELVAFLPSGIPMSDNKYNQILDSCDYILFGDLNPSAQVANYLAQNATTTKEIAHIVMSPNYGVKIFKNLKTMREPL